ncbi:hypothetical protein CEXT_160841 [Caerostris extrusa]|uniref:Uncharacterized protein n=1 Tax=Caerostris extrusa TaxID=172846 RepID=A0AAV4Y3M5_CAEEX|nr:hypothetical protein CEXT_160841 [Caerostris extrusa]
MTPPEHRSLSNNYTRPNWKTRASIYNKTASDKSGLTCPSRFSQSGFFSKKPNLSRNSEVTLALGDLGGGDGFLAMLAGRLMAVGLAAPGVKLAPVSLCPGSISH